MRVDLPIRERAATIGPTDTFDRHFTVRSNNNGTYTVVQQFKNGSFVTDAGPSPGSCDITDGSPPGTVDDGVIGSMHGYFIISNVMTQTSNSPYCDAVNETNDPCNTTIFINTHFAPCYPADLHGHHLLQPLRRR